MDGLVCSSLGLEYLCDLTKFHRVPIAILRELMELGKCVISFTNLVLAKLNLKDCLLAATMQRSYL